MTAATHPGSYRPDIDGLRAIAVLLVLAFHAEVRFFGAGFAGVDVFFVISGYLISRIIFRALAAGTFSFREFYVRRINRIFPALTIVLVACLAAGWVIAMPTEYRMLGKHSFGGSAFVSNVILWREAGYFDSPHKPLLHLWSLAVEEQFYLVWPPLALLAWKRKWNVTRTIWSIVAASFVLNAFMSYRGLAVAAFYFAGTRLWEIGAGALLAHHEDRRSRVGAISLTSGWPREAAAASGLVLLFVTLVVVDHETPWPGVFALLPVAASLLLIGTGPESLTARRILANRALVWIGLISYPLYLWHWPLLVFARLVNGEALSRSVTAAVLASSFFLAWLTYAVVERPVRLGMRKRRSAAVLLPALAAVGCAGLVIQAGLLKPRMFDAATLLDQARTDREGSTVPEGLGRDGRPSVDSIRGKPGESVVMIGDSHIEQYRPRVLQLARELEGKMPTVLLLRYGSCVPMPGIERRGNPSPLTRQPFECARFHRGAIEIAREPGVRVVVYGASWTNYLKNGVTYIEGESDPLGFDGPQTDRAFALLAEEFRMLTDSGKRVYVLLDNPVDAAFDPVSMLPGRLPGWSRRAPATSVPREKMAARSRAADARLREAARLGGALVIDPLDYLCGEVSCPTIGSTGEPIYRDDNHMRASFVRSRVTYMDRVIATR